MLMASTSHGRLPRPSTNSSQRPSTVGGVRRTSTTSNPASLRRRNKARKRKASANTRSGGQSRGFGNEGPLSGQTFGRSDGASGGDIAYMQPAFNEVFPKRTISRDISKEVSDDLPIGLPPMHHNHTRPNPPPPHPFHPLTKAASLLLSNPININRSKPSTASSANLLSKSASFASFR